MTHWIRKTKAKWKKIAAAQRWCNSLNLAFFMRHDGASTSTAVIAHAAEKPLFSLRRQRRPHESTRKIGAGRRPHSAQLQQGNVPARARKVF
jgi:hypothetical protein